MSQQFYIGNLSQNEWIKLNTNYPYIHFIVNKLHEYSGVLDDFNVNIAIYIYKQLLYKEISPKNALRHWNLHLSMNHKLQYVENIDHYRYFQIYMENINYYINKDLDFSIVKI